MRSANIQTGAVPFQQGMYFGANMFGIPMLPTNRNVAPMFFVDPAEFAVNPAFSHPRLNTELATAFLANEGAFPPMSFQT